MAKRLRDTAIWDKKWFRELPCSMKCFVDYILSKCDPAGIWEVDFDAASFSIGERIAEDEICASIITSLNIIKLKENKWFITEYITFQYGENYQSSKVWYSVKKILDRYGIDTVSIRYNPEADTLNIKAKEQVKEKVNIKAKEINSGKESEGNQKYEQFKKAFPNNGSFLNPEVLNWFNLRADENYQEFEKVIIAAGAYAEFWKGLEPDTYPNCKMMKQAIKWLREAQYEIDWKAKLIADKKHGEKEAQRKRGGILG